MNGNMKGTGKKDDPWLVEDAYDFYKLKGINRGGQSNLSYAKLVKNIDFNSHDELKYGWLKSVHYMDSNMLVLDGNGKEVRNIVFKDRLFTTYTAMGSIEKIPGIEFSSVSNVKWVNIILLNSYGELSWLKSNNTSNCSFSITVFSPIDFAHAIPRNMDGCTVSVSGNIGALSFNTGGTPIKRTHFILDLIKTSGTVFIEGCNFDMCYFTGKLDYTDDGIAYYRHIFGGSTTLSNCYFAVDSKVKIGKHKWEALTGTVVNASSFIDKSLITFVDSESTMPTTNGKMYVLTTEQAKDKTELLKIGFPVA